MLLQWQPVVLRNKLRGVCAVTEAACRKEPVRGARDRVYCPRLVLWCEVAVGRHVIDRSKLRCEIAAS